MHDTETDDALAPPLEPGDWVELREPYKPMWETIAEPVQQTMEARVDQITGDTHPELNEDLYHRGMAQIYESGRVDNLVGFDMGVVTEVVSRLSVRETASSEYEADKVREATDGEGYPRNVAIHPFNSVLGVMYLGRGPKPHYIDCHVAELILRHKAADTWDTTYNRNIGEMYAEQFDIPDPFADEE